MAEDLRIRSTMANSMVDLIKTAIDAGAGAGTIKIYTVGGGRPAGPATAVSDQTLLATLTCSDPCGTTSGGVLTFSAVTEDSSADANGTASWARISDSDGNGVVDLDVGTSGAGINLNTTTIVSGGPVRITSGSITVPTGS